MKSLITVLAMLAAAPASAEFAVGAGQSGRGYDAFANKLIERLGGGAVTNYEGSDDISRAVCSGDVQAGLMQIDAIYMRGLEGCAMEVAAFYGEEFAFIIFPPDSPYNALDDLSEGDHVLVDTVGSGTDLFWHNIRAIEAKHGNGSAWSEATGVNGLFSAAPAMARLGKIDAMIVVGDPASAEVTQLLDLGWNVGELQDKDINDQTYNGRSLYNRDSFKFGSGFFKDSETVYIVPSFLAVNAEWASEDRAGYTALTRAASSVQ